MFIENRDDCNYTLAITNEKGNRKSILRNQSKRVLILAKLKNCEKENASLLK